MKASEPSLIKQALERHVYLYEEDTAWGPRRLWHSYEKCENHAQIVLRELRRPYSSPNVLLLGHLCPALCTLFARFQHVLQESHSGCPAPAL